MKRNLVLAVSLLVAGSCMAAAQYRMFKDSNGRSIEARLVKFDQRAEMVTIQRKGGKTSKVSLSIFSADDQVFIRKSIEAPVEKEVPVSAEKEVPPLTKKRVKEIAELFEDAVEDDDMEALRNLFLDPRSVKYDFSHIQEVRVGKADDYTVSIQLVSKLEGMGSNGSYWLTPDGKIKYSPVNGSHPVSRAASAIRTLSYLDRERLDSYRARIGSAVKELEQVNIPTFGIHKDMPWSEIRENVELLREWFFEHADTYDIGEPKLMYPAKKLKVLKSNIKK